jgi:hypothetical protein
MSHTPGPWGWKVSLNGKRVNLVGGKPTFDKIVMDFVRWGMQSASPRFNSAITGNEFNIMYAPHEHPGWVIPFPGRDHHAHWYSDISHPDARLIAAAPSMLEALLEAIECGIVPKSSAREGGASKYVRQLEVADMIRDAIAKATGESHEG